MKKLLTFILFAFCSNSNAALPDTITDPVLREVLESIDAKADNATKWINNFDPGTSVTFPISVSNGGTGATTAAGALANIGGVAANGTGAFGTWPINISGTVDKAYQLYATPSVCPVGQVPTGIDTYGNALDCTLNGGSGVSPLEVVNTNIQPIPGIVTQNLVPRIADNGSVGLSTIPWKSVYANNFYGNGSNITGLDYSGDEVTVHQAARTFSAISSSVTLQGNTFNIANSLVKLDNVGKLPTSVISGLNLRENPALFNIGLGSEAVSNINEGSYNTGFGSYSSSNTGVGTYNTTIGAKAGMSQFPGSLPPSEGNTLIGALSGQYGALRFNTCLGVGSCNGSLVGTLYPTAKFQGNTAIGYLAGFNLTSGLNNVLIGRNTGDALESGDNNILIGSNIDAPTVGIDNYLNIGNLITGVIGGSSVTVQGTLYSNHYVGEGSGITGITSADNTKVLKAGDTMTGQLTVKSSVTVTGNMQSANFSTGVSTHTQICLNGDCVTNWPMPSTDLFFTATASTITPFLQLSTTNPAGQASTATITTASSNIIISTYVYTGFNASFINSGFWHIHSHASVSATAGNLTAKIYYKVFKSSGTIGATETLLIQTKDTNVITTAIQDLDVHGYSADMSWTNGDSIIVRSYTRLSGSGTTPTISTYREGLYQSRLEVPGSNVTFAQAPTAIPNTFTSSITITGASNGYGLSVSSNIFIVGYSSATKYYGDGSSLTGVQTSAISTVTIDALPIGSFIQYGSTTAPSSYLYCDGTNYSTTTYSALFAVIGYKFGGSGANFTCDFRGMFARGLDTTGTIDSEARVIGSSETSKLMYHNTTIVDPGHFHSHQLGGDGWGSGGGLSQRTIPVQGTQDTNTKTTGITATTPITDGVHGVVTLANENTVKNIAVAVMVKYRTALDVVYTTNTVGPLITSSSTYSGQNTFTQATVNFISTPTFTSGIVPFTMTVKTSGTGTYTVPTGVRILVVKTVGGGGGGGAGANTGVSGGAGAASTFGTSLLTANGGYGGCTNSDAAPGGCSAGGATTIIAPAVGWGVTGGFGDSGAAVAGHGKGGSGGNSPLGGGGFGQGGTNVGPSAGVGVANTGGGGGGGGSYGFTYAASGGGAGGYIEAIIKNPSSSYAYSVGTGGTAGGTGVGGGAAGGSGIIIIYEYY